MHADIRGFVFNLSWSLRGRRRAASRRADRATCKASTFITMSDDDIADASGDGTQVVIILVHVVIVFVGAALLGWLYWQNADLRTRFEWLTAYRKWTGSIFGGGAQYDMVSLVTAPQGADVATTRPTAKSGGTARAGRSTKPGFASFKGRSREMELESAERALSDSSDSSGTAPPKEPPEHKHGATTKKATSMATSKATSGSKRSSQSAAAKSSATATRVSKGSSRTRPSPSKE